MPRPLTQKQCPHCKTFKPIEAFPRNRATSSGLSSWCRECHVAATRRWRAENPEWIAAHSESRRKPPAKHICPECGVVFYGRRDRLTCSRRCKDARYRRRHPEEYRAKERRKDARRRARQLEATSGERGEKC